MKRGYVRIYRCIEDNIIFQDEKENKKSAWLDLILMANHTDAEVMVGNTKLIVKRGQKFTSISKLAQRWNWSRSRVQNYLTLLENEGMLYRERICNGTLLTLANYGKYQGKQNTKQSTNLTTDLATDLTTNQSTNQSQTIMSKNDLKNDIKNEKEKDFDSFSSKPKRERPHK